MERAPIALLTLEGSHGKVNQTFIAKVMFAQMPVLQLSPTLTSQMVLANNALVVQLQASPMPTASEHNVSLAVLDLPQTLAQDAFNTEIIRTNARHVPESKYQTSIKMDVLSEPTAFKTRSMIPVTNVNPAKLVLFSMLLLIVALTPNLLSIPIVHVTKNTTHSPRHVSNAQMVKLVIITLVNVLSRLRVATMQIKFNWVKTNAMRADNALLDRHSTDSPTLAPSKLLYKLDLNATATNNTTLFPTDVTSAQMVNSQTTVLAPRT